MLYIRGRLNLRYIQSVPSSDGGKNIKFQSASHNITFKHPPFILGSREGENKIVREKYKEKEVERVEK